MVPWCSKMPWTKDRRMVYNWYHMPADFATILIWISSSDTNVKSWACQSSWAMLASPAFGLRAFREFTTRLVVARSLFSGVHFISATVERLQVVVLLQIPQVYNRCNRLTQQLFGRLVLGFEIVTGMNAVPWNWSPVTDVDFEGVSTDTVERWS